MTFLRDVQRAIHKLRAEGILSVLRILPGYIERKMLKNNKIFNIMTLSRGNLQNMIYSAPSDPYKHIEVGLSRVCYFTTNIDRYKGLGQVHNGNWDQKDQLTPLSEDPRYTGFRQKFKQGKNWEKTAYYDHMKSRFESSGSVYGYQGMSEFKHIRLKYISDLYEDIKKEYQPNFENGHQVPDEDIRSGELRHIHQLEPLVAIGRNGEFYLCDGFHRVIIAKLLGIESIPVNVLARHRQWQAIRDQVAETDQVRSDDGLRNYLDHPDLQDILTNS